MLKYIGVLAANILAAVPLAAVRVWPPLEGRVINGGYGWGW